MISDPRNLFCFFYEKKEKIRNHFLFRQIKLIEIRRREQSFLRISIKKWQSNELTGACVCVRMYVCARVSVRVRMSVRV